MQEKKYYDKINNRLVYIKKEATDNFWDEHWEKYKSKDFFKKEYANKTIVNFTKKYLPIGSKILEGGCGLGDKVYALDKIGYDAIGLDYAERTVELVKENWPHLNIVLGDIFHLPFKDNTLDGYWSLGVIEHFYDGYDDIVSEMKRVIRKDGYLFLTFPAMSPLRKLKSLFGLYANFDGNKKDFYQFALDPTMIVKNYESNGFKLEEKKFIAGYKGLKDEVSFLNPFLIYLNKKQNIFTKIIGKFIQVFVSWFSGHSVLLVLKNRKI
jgi:SAM-dependent methyltransferase